MNSTWSKAVDVLSAVAPTIASAIGGPVAGAAVTTLSRVLLGKGDATEEELAKTIVGADTETLAAIKKAELEFKETMAKLDVDLERIAQEDRESARKREMEVKDRVPSVLGTALISGFFGVLIMVMFYSIPADAKDIVNIMLGYLGAMVTSVVTYYFGSSAGSAAKNRILADKHRQ